QRIGNGELPLSLLQRLYAFAGGTPRFLERLRTLLRTLAAAELDVGLDAGSGALFDARDKFLEDHFGPKLFELLSPEARTLLSRLSLSEWPLPTEVLTTLTGLESGTLEVAIGQAVTFGLLQVFEEAESPMLYLPPGVWRGWLMERVSDDERKAAHGMLAAF